MNIIRDEDFGGIMMVPLWSQYNLHRCNVRDCTNKQTTIVTGLIDQPFALCDEHYFEAKKNGSIKCTLDFCAVGAN